MIEEILKDHRELIIRDAEESDAVAILDYLNRVGGESKNLLFGRDEYKISEEDEIRIIRSYKESERDCLILGIVEEEIVSVVSLSSSKRERISHISNFAISVKKDHWNNGVGTCMLKRILELSSENENIKTINLMVNVNNKCAIKLYKKFGFEEVGIFKDYFYIDGTYIDSIIMNKYL